jgi:hypothetical protein
MEAIMLLINNVRVLIAGLAFAASATAASAVHAQGTALVSVSGGVSEEACASIVADTTGHIGAGIDGQVQLTGVDSATGGRRMIPPPHAGMGKGFEDYPLQRLYNQLPGNAKGLDDSRSQEVLKQIAATYVKLQSRFSRLRIDVVTIPVRGTSGLSVEPSRAYAEAIAKALVANGVQYVHVDGKSLSKRTGIKRTS